MKGRIKNSVLNAHEYYSKVVKKVNLMNPKADVFQDLPAYERKIA